MKRLRLSHTTVFQLISNRGHRWGWRCYCWFLGNVRPWICGAWLLKGVMNLFGCWFYISPNFFQNPWLPLSWPLFIRLAHIGDLLVCEQLDTTERLFLLLVIRLEWVMSDFGSNHGLLRNEIDATFTCWLFIYIHASWNSSSLVFYIFFSMLLEYEAGVIELLLLSQFNTFLFFKILNFSLMCWHYLSLCSILGFCVILCHPSIGGF